MVTQSAHSRKGAREAQISLASVVVLATLLPPMLALIWFNVTIPVRTVPPGVLLHDVVRGYLNSSTRESVRGLD
jgi:hypothetical protein